MTVWKRKRDASRQEQQRLRDEFAKAYLNGAASDPTTREWHKNAPGHARCAYLVADEMLKARTA